MKAPPPRLVYRKLLASYGEQGWWPVTARSARSPRYRPGAWGDLSERQRAEICMGAILTQNTSWSNVQRVLLKLHAAGVWDFERISGLPEPRLAALIRSSGYFRQKAKKLKAFSRHFLGERRSLSAWLSRPLEALRAELLGLWGVGPETADSILLYAGGRRVFVIDAYTLRIGSRLGWFKAHGYEQAQGFLTRLLPVSARLYAEFHALLVELAKRHCRARPVCLGCPLLEVCSHGQKTVKALA